MFLITTILTRNHPNFSIYQTLFCNHFYTIFNNIFKEKRNALIVYFILFKKTASFKLLEVELGTSYILINQSKHTHAQIKTETLPSEKYLRSFYS
jgi:hypothetical protein